MDKDYQRTNTFLIY